MISIAEYTGDCVAILFCQTSY